MPEDPEASPELQLGEQSQVVVEGTPGEDTQQADPDAELTAWIADVTAKLERVAELDPAQVRTNLGRIGGLQRDLDALKKTVSESDLRVEFKSQRQVLNTIAAGLADSDVLDAMSKTELRRLLGEVQRSAERAAIVQEVRKEVTPPAGPTVDPVWQDATDDLREYAVKMNVDLATVPDTVVEKANATRSPARAVRLVSAWIDEQAAATATLAAKKVTAAKTVAPTGGASDDAALIAKFAENPSVMPPAERTRAEKAIRALQR